jgi:hypothetical protein
MLGMWCLVVVGCVNPIHEMKWSAIGDNILGCLQRH